MQYATRLPYVAFLELEALYLHTLRGELTLRRPSWVPTPLCFG